MAKIIRNKIGTFMGMLIYVRMIKLDSFVFLRDLGTKNVKNGHQND